MKIEQSIVLKNCNSLDEVATLINNGGTSDFDKSEIAAQYILSCMEDNRDLSGESLEAHYDILEKAGAKMDFEDVRVCISQIEDQ